jgi:hypothetical protein
MRFRPSRGRPGWIRPVVLVAVTACGSQTGRPSGSSQDSARVSAPAESLVATSSSKTEIWFTLARNATGTDGSHCVERGIEIRRGATRLKVPLLYTGSAPVLLNDSTMRAVLWTHCSPGDAYLVSLKNGQPVRERAREE